MPIFMNYEGIKGSASAGNRTNTGVGGIITGNGSSGPHVKNSRGAGNGGVWKTTDFLTGGTAKSRGGVHVAVGDLDYPASSNAIEISRITFPNAPSGFDFVDGRDASAAVKAGALFRAARVGFSLSDGVVVSIQTSGVANAVKGMRCGNNLKQLAISGRTIPLIQIFVGNGGNSNHVAVGLENVKVTSYQLGGHDGAAMASLSLNFGKIEYRTLPPTK